MDLVSGGDLRYHLIKQTKFNEEQTSKIKVKLEFFVACILVALEYLHMNGIMHRDIKPENLVFERKGTSGNNKAWTGYLRLTDLGIARIWKPENSSDTSGTPGYMAPEVMCRSNHGVSVDYYAVGIIVYECMNARRPYYGKSRQEIRDQILAKQVQIRKSEIPYNWSN
jgi:serine/threonine protein kinase